MKMIYNQHKNDTLSSLNRLGIENCFFKKLIIAQDEKRITNKRHHHTCIEIHIIAKGYQVYEIDGKPYKISENEFIIIYPNVTHKIVESCEYTQKYALTFCKKIEVNSNFFVGEINPRINDNINYLLTDAAFKKEYSALLIENNILEIIVRLLRIAGVKEENVTSSLDVKENVVLSLAKQYISDNIERAITLPEVAAYCHLSTKQLTRIFNEYEGTPPGEYINKKRIKIAQRYLNNDSYSLKQISELLNFTNEYYFNSFFKKHTGLPPGKYRKMIGK